MANKVTIATNASGRGGKWLPYNHQPFYLGETADGTGSTDGEIYITQTTGTSDRTVKATVVDEYNCDFYYTIKFTTNSGVDDWVVRKYNKLNDSLIDIIYASTITGGSTGLYWNSSTAVLTIDIGIIVRFDTTTAFDDGDIYKINTPSVETMRRRRIYHGGYSSYVRMPYTEGKVFRTNIIPTNLKNVNVTCLAGLPGGIVYNDILPLAVVTSNEDASGNIAVTFAMEWNTNPQGAESADASTGLVPPDGETWQIGTTFAYDVNPSDISTPLPVAGQAPASDATPTLEASNTNAISISGKAGYGRIKAEFMNAAGSSVILAHNQWWPITIILG